MSGEDSASLDAKVLRWVTTSGATVEMNVARVMSMRALNVLQSMYYTDSETQLSREIDVVAFREVQISEGKRLGAYLVIECKYAPTPWVIFRGSLSTGEGQPNFDRIVTRYGGQWLNSMRFHPAIEQGRFFQVQPQVGYSMTTSNLGIKAQSATTPLADRDLAYKAVVGATKAARYFASTLDSTLTTFGVVFPVVVLQGKLFEAWLDGDEPRVQEIDRGQIRWHNPAGERPIIVDVVTLEQTGALADEFRETAESLMHHGRDTAIEINTTGIW